MKVEIYTKENRKFPYKKFPNFKYAGDHKYVATMKKEDAKKCVKKARWSGLYARCFDPKYDRSSTYRKAFMKANPPDHGRYICVYCGKMIKPYEMTVDHVIPVSLAKKSKSAQRKLNTKKGVNDLSNLVPSCWRCNQRKSDSGSITWRIKATLGKHKSFWIFRNLSILVLVILIIYFFSRSKYYDMEINEFIRVFPNDVITFIVTFLRTIFTKYFFGIIRNVFTL